MNKNNFFTYHEYGRYGEHFVITNIESVLPYITVKSSLGNSFTKLCKIVLPIYVTVEAKWVPPNTYLAVFWDNTPYIELTAILPMNDSEVQKVPVQAIRERAFKNYDNIVVINREELLQTINRLSIFSYSSTSVDRTFGIFEFSNDEVTIKDINKVNSEKVKYSNSINLTDNYICVLDFNDIKLVLETTSDEFINLGFGDHQAIVCSRNNIYNVIPEIN